MGERKPPAQIIQEALHLDSDPERVQRFYEEWAAWYDEDVDREAYRAPRVAVDLLDGWVGHAADSRATGKADLAILDAGCGTGLVGQALHERGYRAIHGFDLSPAMVAEAERCGVYRELRAEVDLNRPLEGYAPGAFDAAIACGVFTSGHVHPSSLAHLARVVRPGGLVIVSTRTAYCEETGYEEEVGHLVARGDVEILEVLREAPYTSDSRAHYWLYRVG